MLSHVHKHLKKPLSRAGGISLGLVGIASFGFFSNGVSFAALKKSVPTKPQPLVAASCLPPEVDFGGSGSSDGTQFRFLNKNKGYPCNLKLKRINFTMGFSVTSTQTAVIPGVIDPKPKPPKKIFSLWRSKPGSPKKLSEAVYVSKNFTDVTAGDDYQDLTFDISSDDLVPVGSHRTYQIKTGGTRDVYKKMAIGSLFGKSQDPSSSSFHPQFGFPGHEHIRGFLPIPTQWIDELGRIVTDNNLQSQILYISSAK